MTKIKMGDRVEILDVNNVGSEKYIGRIGEVVGVAKEGKKNGYTVYMMNPGGTVFTTTVKLIEAKVDKEG